MVERGRKDAVHDDRVDVVAEQRQIRVRTPRFRDDETLGIHDETRARDVAVGEQLAYAVESLVEPTNAAEHLVARDREARQRG